MGEIKDYELKAPYFVENKLWTSPSNFEFSRPLPEMVTIHDVTLRDGDQTPGVVFLEEDRVQIARALNKMRVPRIEAGMPVVSKAVENAMRRMVDEKFDSSKIFSFSRAMRRDVELSADIGVDGIIIEYLMNPAIIKAAYRETEESLMGKLIPSINLAKEKGMYVSFMGWDWFRAPIEFTKWVVGELYSKTDLDGLVMVDTFGCTTPDAVGEMFRRFKDWFPRLHLEFHGHNDIGMANANALAAVQNGAEVVHGAILGLGDRCGNTATEEITTILEYHKGVDTGIDCGKIYETARLVSELSGVKPYDSKPLLGQRPMMVEAGVGIDIGYKLQQANKNYGCFGTPLNPQVIGRNEQPQIVLGKNSGKSTVKMALMQMGLTATEEQVKQLLSCVVDEAMKTKSLVSKERFSEIVAEVCGAFHTKIQSSP